jgi:hypothetical protein
MAVKAMDLFDAYAKNALPKDRGYLVTSYFSNNSVYSRYEIVSYNNVKSIYPSEEGLTFQTDGKKIYILIEPSNYPNKGMEPYVRSTDEKIPLRFSELEMHNCKNQTRIYWAKEAVISYGAFTIARPTGINFSFCFYQLPDMYQSLQVFFEKTFSKEASVPFADAKKVAAAVIVTLKKELVWATDNPEGAE